MFNRISVQLGPHTVDLFTMRWNHQVDKYVSWRPDPGVMMTIAFHISWVGLHGYAFSPICLIGKCLKKVRMEHDTVALVALLWQKQPWYPMLLELITVMHQSKEILCGELERTTNLLEALGLQSTIPNHRPSQHRRSCF